MNIKLAQLKSFVALAEELHFGKAAARLNVSQPPFSRQIQFLEREMGVALVVRSNQRVTLTPAGAAFYKEVGKVFSALDHAAKQARGVAVGEAGRMVVGMTGSISFGIAPRILERFRREYPDVRLEIQHQMKAHQIEGLIEHRITLGFTRSPVRLAEIVSEPLQQEDFIAALHETHPLAQGREVSLAKLANDRFILYRGNTWPSVADEIIALCADAGFSPSVDQEADEMQTAVSLVAAGLGVAIVAKSIGRLLLPGVVYRPITIDDHRRPKTTLHMIYRKGDADAVLLRFIALARLVAQEDVGELNATAPKPRVSRTRAFR